MSQITKSASSANNKQYCRKLSAIERYNLVINEIVRYDVEAIFEGEGELHLDAWEDAVAIAAEANPGARIRLISVLGFCKWVDSGIPPHVEIVQAPDWNGRTEVGHSELQQPFKPLMGGPICDIKLLPGSPARILIRACHGAMDARGIAHFILDIFRVLRGEQPIGARDTITDLEIRLKHQDKVNITPQQPVITIPAMPVSASHSGVPVYIWRWVTLNNNVKNILPKMAVFLTDQARRHDTGATVFTIPVDFRGLREEASSTANLTGYVRIPVEATDSPRDVMRNINQQIRLYADCQNPGYLKVLPWIPVRLLQKQLAKKVNQLLHTPNTELPTGGIVSLGHLDMAAWTYPAFKTTAAVGIPGSVGKLNVVMHNYSDRTDVVFSTPAAYNEQGQLDNLIDTFKAEFNKIT